MLLNLWLRYVLRDNMYMAFETNIGRQKCTARVQESRIVLGNNTGKQMFGDRAPVCGYMDVKDQFDLCLCNFYFVFISNRYVIVDNSKHFREIIG